MSHQPWCCPSPRHSHPWSHLGPDLSRLDSPRRVSHLGLRINPEFQQQSKPAAGPPASQFQGPGTQGETEGKEETAREEVTETEGQEVMRGAQPCIAQSERRVRSYFPLHAMSVQDQFQHYLACLVVLNFTFRCTIHSHSMSILCIIHTTS